MTVVRRDDYGIPHLRAPSVLDLARLQGGVTAEDRAWQLEWFRWRMEGRTAEYVGADGLPWDRFARQVRLEATARACYEGLDAETRAWVTAYVDGVNSRMPLGLVRAPEIRALGLGWYASAPRPWEPWTPLGIFWAVHLLFGTFPAKLFNDHVARRLGDDWLPLFHAEGVTQSGSNAWVVSGARTASGLPLIGGDPHRNLEVPGCYQQIGLACDEFDVLGFAFPGVPGVQHFAHAGSVAWGITNAMADYQDLTREELRARPDGTVEARGVAGDEPTTVEVETVVVRGSGAVEVSVEVPVVVTSRGPVVTGLEHGLAAALDPDGAGPDCLSLRTPSQVTSDLGFGAFLPLLRSRTVDDVAAALARWVEPVNSAVVADASGQVRHLVVGRVPERAEVNWHRSVDAWDPAHSWSGWRAGEAMPVDDVLVGANDRASGGGLGVDYSSPFRAARIRELLGDRTGLTAGDFTEIHVDTLNGQAALMRELVSASPVTGAAAAVRDELLQWDGHSRADSRGALLFAGWRHALAHWISEHPALSAIHEPTGHSTLFSIWLEVPRQVGIAWASLVAGAAARGVDIASGVVAALERVAQDRVVMGGGARARAGVHGDRAVWGDRHRFDPIHPLDGIGGAPSVPEAAVAGDKGCVLAAGSAPGVTDRCYVGPAARYVWDLADRDSSRWVVPLGASGIAGDRHFADQLPLWIAGGSVPAHPGPVQE